MKNTRLWLIPAFAIFVTVGALVVSGDAQPGAVKQIVPGVWFREGEFLAQGHCNNIFIEMKDYLIVVDANFPSGARAAMADARKVSSKPVKYVFDTHHHADHAYGNAVWTRAGAVTLAYAAVAGEMKRVEPGRWRQIAKKRQDVAELNMPSVEPPKETFTETPHVIDDGARRVEFHFFGWAHTRGDGFVYLPKEKVLCTGDAVVNGPFNATGDSNLKNWPNVIRTAQKLAVDHVLPGHGGPGGKELFAGQLQFFLELRKAVAAAVKQGKKLDDIVKTEGERMSTSITLPGSVKNWTGDLFLARQVKDMYGELTQNRPAGEINAQ